MYRPLTDSEIRQLEQQGCHAESWTRVRVAEGFRPEAVERVRFCGTVELGRFERPVEIEPGLFLPSGLSDAVLADCCVGDDCLVRHVGGYLRGYHLEEGATVMNCGTLTLDDEAEFGMDGALAGPDEGQPRCVAVCDRLAAPMAALMTSDSAAAAPMRRLAARRAVAWASTPRGVVGRGAVVVNTARVANTYIGDAGEVNGAALLSECALLSTTDAPVWVGTGVVAEETVVSAGSAIDGATRLYHCYIGPYIRTRGLQAVRRAFFPETPPDGAAFRPDEAPEQPGARLDTDGWTPERPTFRTASPLAFADTDTYDATSRAAELHYLNTLLTARLRTPAGRAGDLLPRSTEGTGRWTEQGGRLMPLSEWEQWVGELKADGFLTFDEAADALDAIDRRLPDHLWAWAYDRLLRLHGLDTLTPDDARRILDSAGQGQ